MEIIQRLLRRAWWRLVAIDLLRTLAVTLTIAASVLVLWRLLESVVGVPASWNALILSAVCASLLGAIVWSLIRVRRGGAVARQVDERAGLRETLSTALCVQNEPDAWSKATVEMAGQKAQAVKLKEAIPVEAPSYWPAPIAGMALLAIMLLVPVIDLPALFGQEDEAVIEQTEVQQVKTEVEQMQKELETEAQRLGLDFDMDDEAADEALKPEDMTPEEIQAAAVKKLTQLTDKLDSKMQEQGKEKLETLEKQLQKLRQPGPGPAEELARAMARGNFDKAREELSKLAQQMRAGELSPEQEEQLQKQMDNLAQQLDTLSEDKKQIERSLREAGMDADQAKQAASDPEALKKAMEQIEGMSQEQKQQLMDKVMSQMQACQQCQNMGQAMSQMAQAMQSQQGQEGMSAQGQAAMDQLGDMLSEMEQLQGDMQSMQAMMNAAQQQMQKMGQGFCENPGMGDWRAGDISRQGMGSGGPGQGDGVSPEAKETSVTYNETKANVQTREGPIIGSRMVYEGQVRGESRVEFQQATKAAAASASDAIESMQVPREYEAAVMKYFGALEEQAEDASDGSDAPSGD